MDPQPQASFIPKKPLSSGPRTGGRSGLLYLVAVFVFVVSLVAAGSAFAYTRYLSTTLASKAHSLELAQGAYEPGSIQDLTRLDQRILNAKVLLARHVAPSAIFDILSNETLAQVQFTSFSFQPKDSGVVTIELEGVANSFSTVALQADEFGASKALNDVVFSGISVGEFGRVTFSVTASIDQEMLLYVNNIRTPAGTPPQGTTTSSL